MVRVIRQTRELVDLVRDLRQIERAPVAAGSGPIAQPIDPRDERQHAAPRRLGG